MSVLLSFSLASDLSVHLDDLSQSLLRMIESINSPTDPIFSSPIHKSTFDPLQQISGILSNHLESLEWVDGAVREIECKVIEAEKRIKEMSTVVSSADLDPVSFYKEQGFAR